MGSGLNWKWLPILDCSPIASSLTTTSMLNATAKVIPSSSPKTFASWRLGVISSYLASWREIQFPAMSAMSRLGVTFTQLAEEWCGLRKIHGYPFNGYERQTLSLVTMTGRRE